MSFEDRETFWAALLIGISVINWLISVVILGLSVGTVQNTVFTLGVWSFLEPLWDIACSDIAAAAFIFVASLATCVTVAYRTKPLMLINIWGSGILLFFTMALGISTLVIADEKNPALRVLTVLVCLSTWGASNGTFSYNPGTHDWVESAADVDTLASLTRLVPFGLDIFKWKVVPKSYEDCDYFNDLMTPCGALLIVVGIIYIFKVIVGYKLYTKIGKEMARLNSRFNNDAKLVA